MACAVRILTNTGMIRVDILLLLARNSLSPSSQLPRLDDSQQFGLVFAGDTEIFCQATCDCGVRVGMEILFHSRVLHFTILHEKDTYVINPLIAYSSARRIANSLRTISMFSLSSSWKNPATSVSTSSAALTCLRPSGQRFQKTRSGNRSCRQEMTDSCCLVPRICKTYRMNVTPDPRLRKKCRLFFAYPALPFYVPHLGKWP